MSDLIFLHEAFEALLAEAAKHGFQSRGTSLAGKFNRDPLGAKSEAFKQCKGHPAKAAFRRQWAETRLQQIQQSKQQNRGKFTARKKSVNI